MTGSPVVLERMRKYHNYIKNLYLEQMITRPSRLLDLASGKGGDIHKWIKNDNIVSVDGFDINSTSVHEAINRLARTKTKKSIQFGVLDLSKSVLHCEEPYHIITCYFAFHYFFKSPKTLNSILTSIDNCSANGTILIITALDGNLVRNIESDNYKLSLIPGNAVNYNKKLEVFIKDSVLNEPTIEYIVRPEFLVKKLSEIDFKLIETKLFSEFPFKRFKLSDEEKNYSFLNRVYVFKKSKSN